MLGRSIRNVAIIVLALLWLVPTYLLIVNGVASVKGFTGTAHWLPTSFGFFDNVGKAWSTASFGPAMLNSLVYAVVSGGLAVLLAALGAFAVVVMPVRRRTMWFWVIYAGTLFPLQMFLRPLFSTYANLNLYDTKLGLFIVYTAMCIPFGFFVVRNYLASVPRDMVEAARIDGAPWWRVFVSIHLPLGRPAMAAAFIFQFVWVWNDLLFGITLSFSPGVRPLMAALAGLQGSYSTVGPPVVLAGALIVSLPTVILFFAFQRLFVSSLRTNI
ncbi:MAG TPA: carbohydrate ABC transporter permease [Mycobacteriales bacterium]|jgi:multiple sugar transport system permease protein|nr:carbohydrate ABC transporter permease [Mycobacteriales bacterium]